MESRNYVIDLLRFLFCIMIVIHHSFVMYGEYLFAPTGYMGVEFFFIVTGFYMMNRVEHISIDNMDIGFATRSYIVPKIMKIFLFLFISIIASILLQYVSEVNVDIINNSVNAIPELLMLQMFGINSSFPTGVAWYLSAMFMALLVLYPLSLSYKSMYKCVIAPLITLFLIGYLMHCTGAIGSEPGIYLGIFPRGVLRAFAEISLGAFLYDIVIKINSLKVSTYQAIVLGIIEISGYLGIACIARKYQAGQTDLYILLLLIVSITITFSQKSITYRLFNWKIWGVLGKFSMVWFLNNFYVARCVPSLFPNHSKKELLYIYILFSFVMAVLVYIIVIVLKACWNRMKCIAKRYEKEITI